MIYYICRHHISDQKLKDDVGLVLVSVPQDLRSHINLCSFDNFVLLSKIVIEGIRGASYAGDIALDDFSLDDSPCPPEGL